MGRGCGFNRGWAARRRRWDGARRSSNFRSAGRPGAPTCLGLAWPVCPPATQTYVDRGEARRGRSTGNRRAGLCLARAANQPRTAAPTSTGPARSRMSVVLVVLWAASAATVVASQAPGEAKEWLHDAVREGDETAVRTALSRGARELANTPDQCANESPLQPLHRMLSNRDGRAAQLGSLRSISPGIERWPNCWSKLGPTFTGAKTIVRMAVEFT